MKNVNLESDNDNYELWFLYHTNNNNNTQHEYHFI